MDNQGFVGALIQYWTVEDKPRLHRRNSWFEDHQPSVATLRSLLFIGVFATILFVVFSMIGVIL